MLHIDEKCTQPQASAIMAISAVRAGRVAMHKRDLAAREALFRTVGKGHGSGAQSR
jgi:hypothetical protein